MPALLISPENRERFWKHVKKGTGDDACWQWQGSLHRVGGYARLYLERKGSGRKDCHAARFAYEAENGPLESDVALIPTCNNRGCVRPSHWKPVSLAEARNQKAMSVHVKIHEVMPPIEMLHVKHFGGTGAPSKGPALVESAPPPSCNALKTVPLLRKLGSDVGVVVAAIPQLATVHDTNNTAELLGQVLKSVGALGARIALLESLILENAPPRQEDPPSEPETSGGTDDGSTDGSQLDEGLWLDELWHKVGAGPTDRERMASLFDAALSQRPHGAAALYLVMEWGADFKRQAGRPAESPAELEAFVTSSGLLVSPA